MVVVEERLPAVPSSALSSSASPSSSDDSLLPGDSVSSLEISSSRSSPSESNSSRSSSRRRRRNRGGVIPLASRRNLRLAFRRDIKRRRRNCSLAVGMLMRAVRNRRVVRAASHKRSSISCNTSSWERVPTGAGGGGIVRGRETTLLPGSEDPSGQPQGIANSSASKSPPPSSTRIVAIFMVS